MAVTESFQISEQQAELYEERFVPALFASWVDPVLDASGARPGDQLLDVACGTGVVARHAAERVAPGGRVTGLDLNPAMLRVAARLSPELDWRQGDVAALPFDADSFDVVTCQSAVMFFPDVVVALREMARVARRGGTVALQAFARRDDQPAYGPWIRMVARHAGDQALQMLGTYWVHGDSDLMRKRCEDAGLTVSEVHHHERPAEFPSVTDMVLTEVNATPLADRLSPEQLRAIVADSHDVLETYTDAASGRLTIPLAGYVLVGTPLTGSNS